MVAQQHLVDYYSDLSRRAARKPVRNSGRKGIRMPRRTSAFSRRSPANSHDADHRPNDCPRRCDRHRPARSCRRRHRARSAGPERLCCAHTSVPVYTAARVFGSAVTVLCGPGDNLIIHAAITVAKAGDVLVVTTTSESTDGMFGELLAQSCMAHGIAGLVIDAGVRDTTELTELRISRLVESRFGAGHIEDHLPAASTFRSCAPALQSHPATSSSATLTASSLCRGPRRNAVAAAVDQRLAKEERTRERLKAGIELYLYGLRDVLAERGVVWRDE